MLSSAYQYQGACFHPSCTHAMQCNANGSNKQRLLRAREEDANYASSAVLPSPHTAASNSSTD